MSKGNTICWTDIPVNNLDRAIQFYSAVLGTAVTKQSMPGMELGLLPHANEMFPGAWFTPKITNRLSMGRSFT
jgi:hypothetical protein